MCVCGFVFVLVLGVPFSLLNDVPSKAERKTSIWGVPMLLKTFVAGGRVSGPGDADQYREQVGAEAQDAAGCAGEQDGPGRQISSDARARKASPVGLAWAKRIQHGYHFRVCNIYNCMHICINICKNHV